MRGDRQSFEVLLLKYERPVFNAAYRMLNSRDDALDVTQTVFLKVFENFAQYDPQRRFFSWIYRITLNESINWIGRQKRLQPLAEETSEEAAGPEEEAQNAGIAKEVQVALMTLTEDYRTVIVLKHFLECSYSEISEVLGIPEKTVKSRLYTARQLMKDALGTRN
ncbi:MAG TPA: RNA polymerase sigma factor [Woeseiaceae bacterium]